MAGRRAGSGRPVTRVQTPDVADPAMQRAFDVLTRAVSDLQARRLLDLFTSTESGYVPASGSDPDTVLHADGTWRAASGGGGGAVTSVTAGSSKVTVSPTTGDVVVDVVPTNFAGIPQSGIVDLISDLAGKSNVGHTHVKADITDFAHTHAIADVTGLQAALDDKIDEVVAGTNLSGGGTSGAVTLNVVDSPSFAGDVTLGDNAAVDTHIINGNTTVNVASQLSVNRSTAGALGLVVEHLGAGSNAAFLEAQDTTGRRIRLQANGSSGSGNTIVGNVTSHGLDIYTANTARMSITAAGAVAVTGSTLTVGGTQVVLQNRAINTTAPLAGGGNLSADRTLSLNDNGITDAKLRDSAALSVIGRSANSVGDPGDIAAGTDGHVLRRSGTTLGFGTIPAASVTGLITSVNAGTNLSGGGSSGAVTLNVVDSPTFAGNVTVQGTSALNDIVNVTTSNTNSLIAVNTVSATTQSLVDSIAATSAGTFDTTAAIALSQGISGRSTATRSTGANQLYGIGVFGSSEGAQVNQGLVGNAFGAADANIGVYSFASGGTLNYSGWFAAGDFVVEGPARFDSGVTLGNAAGDAHVLNGTINANSTAGSNGQVLTVVSGLPQWVTPAAGGNINGSGTTGALAKFTGATAIGDSIISESGSMATVTGNLTLTGTLVVGDDSAVDGLGLFGYYAQSYAPAAGATSSANASAVTATGTYNTTAAPLQSVAVRASNTSTRSAGANALVNYGVNASASGAQLNIGVYGSGTQYGVYSAGPLLSEGNITAEANISVAGNATLGDGSADAHTLNGNLTLQNSPTAGPLKVGAVQARVFLGRQIFTSSGTYTPTTGTRAVLVKEVGGGGGGGGGNNGGNSAVGGGGASGEYLEKWISAGGLVTGGTVTIGAGGTGGNQVAGGTGGDTSVVVNGTTWTARGGGGGGRITFGGGGLALTAGGSGQASTSTGDINYQQDGGHGLMGTTNPRHGGYGGSNPLGSGGGQQYSAGGGLAPRGRGGGGGGAFDLNATNQQGAAGSAGIVIIEEYA